LGVGNSRFIPNIVNLTKLGPGVKYCAAQGKTTYVINGGGQVLKWPNPGYVEKFTPMPVPIRDASTKFTSLSCGTGFVIGLTVAGYLFSHGLNEFGQLGLCDCISRDGFVNIKYFKDNGDKIVDVSCGHAHACAKNSSGSLFTWGHNGSGQLGQGGQDDSHLPKAIRIPEYKNNIFKVRCAQAGYHNTYV